MAREVLTYGILPTYEAFSAAFDDVCGDDDFEVVNDHHVGSDTFTCSALYGELEKIVSNDDRELGDAADNFASGVITTLGFEWV